MWCWCVCPALRSTVFFLKCTKMQGFALSPTLEGGHSLLHPHPSQHNIFHTPPPLAELISFWQCWAWIVVGGAKPVSWSKLCEHSQWLFQHKHYYWCHYYCWALLHAWSMKVRPIATDVVWSVCMCLLVTTVSCAKTAEPVEMPFGVWTRVGPRNHVLGRSRDPNFQTDG